MNKSLFFFCTIVIMSSSHVLKAQWTAADSVHLSNILSGKEDLKINPMFEKSIRDGSLLNTGKNKPQLMDLNKENIPIEIDFSHFNIKPERSLWKTKEEIEQLPPQVFWLYFPELGDKDAYGNKIYRVNERFHDYLKPLAKLKKGTLESLDFNDALSYAFSPHYRQLINNRKQAKAYKTYIDPSSNEVLAKRKEYLEKYPEAALPDNDSTIISLESDSVRKEQADSLKLEIGIPTVLLEGIYLQ